MVFPFPPNSKSRVRRAGHRIAKSKEVAGDYPIIDNWRASHGYVINTFQSWLKGHLKKTGINAAFAQRLKRRNTVIDKLRRFHPDGSPIISDVTSMHDFAGCRIIFDDLEQLYYFRDYIRSNHVLRNVDHRPKHNRDKYDYIKSPTAKGYRGVHEVFVHKPRSHIRGQEKNRPWHGLLAEFQFRTPAQHAWATAVEISDLLDRERTKFTHEHNDRVTYFALASEIIARRYENKKVAFEKMSLKSLNEQFWEAENDLKIIHRLKALRKSNPNTKFKRHNVLNLIEDFEGNPKLEVFTFSNAESAIRKANDLESDMFSLNAVYVRADDETNLKNLYRNYFNDPIDFVKLMERAK